MYSKDLFFEAVRHFQNNLPPTYDPAGRLFLDDIRPGVRAIVVRVNNGHKAQESLVFLSSPQVDDSYIITARVLLSVETPPTVWHMCTKSLSQFGITPEMSFSGYPVAWSDMFYTLKYEEPLNRRQLLRFIINDWLRPHLALWINKILGW